MQHSIHVSGLEGLVGLIRWIARFVRGFAFLIVLMVAAIAAALAPDGLDAAELVLVVVLLAPAAILLLFAGGLGRLVALPERLRRMPNQGADQLRELTQIAGETRRAGFRRAPFLLWRLRGVVGSSRDLIGFALPLRVLTPGFLGLTALAAFLGMLVLGGGFIALIVLALG